MAITNQRIEFKRFGAHKHWTYKVKYTDGDDGDQTIAIPLGGIATVQAAPAAGSGASVTLTVYLTESDTDDPGITGAGNGLPVVTEASSQKVFTLPRFRRLKVTSADNTTTVVVLVKVTME